MASVSLQSAKISRALMKMNLSGRKQLVSTQSWSPRKWLEKPWSLFFAIICTVLVLQLETSENLSTTAHSLAAVTLMIAILWISEALPVILTSALPLALFPLFEIASFDEVWPVYLKDLIWLFFGGFQLAFAVEKCGLHKRIAMGVLRVMGAKPDRVVLGFMLAGGLLSMWLFNTSTTLMLLPVALAVVRQIDPQKSSQLAEACLLGLAYGASLGGTGTYLGTAPNGVFREQAAVYDASLTFGEWMLFATPLSIGMILMVWLYLTRFAFPLQNVKTADLSEVYGQITPWSQAEKNVGLVFLVTVSMWMGKGYVIDQFPMMGSILTDGRIAVIATVLLLIMPTKASGGSRLLTHHELKKTPWEILVLFGGGFAIAYAFKTTGLSAWVGGELKALVSGWHIFYLVLTVVLCITFLTEITSNTATANVMLPIIGSLAVASEIQPALVMLPATLAASCALMMPVATPPNAIVYGTKVIGLRTMARVGFGINILTALAITIWTLSWGPLVLPF